MVDRYELTCWDCRATWLCESDGAPDPTSIRCESCGSDDIEVWTPSAIRESRPHSCEHR
jgi:hypothetical protein